MREEMRRLPGHDAERCGKVCYNKTMATLDPTAHESYATLCPSPLVMDCEEREGDLVSTCAFPNPGGKAYTLGNRVEDLVAGVLNYELNPNSAAEPAKLSLDFAPDFVPNFVDLAPILDPTGLIFQWILSQLGAAKVAWSHGSME